MQTIANAMTEKKEVKLIISDDQARDSQGAQEEAKSAFEADEIVQAQQHDE